MAVVVKHQKTSAVADSGDANLVQPSDWNADHTLTGLGSMAEADVADYYTAAEVDAGFLAAGSITQYTDEMTRDAIGAALVAGANVTITVDDPANTITIAATSGGASISAATITLGDGAGVREAESVVSAPGVTSSQRANVWLAPGSDADENVSSMVDINSISAACETDALRVFMSFREPQSGPILIQYQVS